MPEDAPNSSSLERLVRSSRAASKKIAPGATDSSFGGDIRAKIFATNTAALPGVEIARAGPPSDLSFLCIMRRAMMAVFAVFALAGCGGGEGAGPGGTYSCQATFPGADGGAGSLAVCVDASGGSAQDRANNQQQCVAQGNMFVPEPCPHVGALGGCRQSAGTGAVLTTWYYGDGDSSTDDIRKLCEGLASVAPKSLMIEFVLP